jgi:outer membrane protein assembly factor BamA
MALYARASGIEVVRYNGQGNETTLTEEDEYYRVRQEQYLLSPTIVFPFARHAELGLGPSAEFIKTRDDDGRIADATSPYGGGAWGQLAGRARLQWDSRDDERYPTHGVVARMDGAVFPAWWDVDSAYGSLEGSVSGYLTGTGLPLRPTIAARVGGRKVWGAYPFFSSAFIGDAASVRLGRQHRYAGSASAYGNVELRLRVTRFFVILPGEIGFFGLADAGRVFVAGEPSGRWHTAFGGGVWLALLQSRSVLSAAVARSPARTGVYFGTGMTF